MDDDVLKFVIKRALIGPKIKIDLESADLELSNPKSVRLKVTSNNHPYTTKSENVVVIVVETLTTHPDTTQQSS